MKLDLRTRVAADRWSAFVAGLRRLNDDSRGQVLPLALAALALGSLLVSPFLVDASVNLLASRHVDSTIKDYYSADAGVEWALWRLENNPALTNSAEYTDVPLQPTPPALNGSPFPTTEVRRVPDAGLSETIAPEWQAGGSYDFASTEGGSIFAIVDVQAPSVRMKLCPAAADCSLTQMTGASPYELQLSDAPAGSYRLLVETSPAAGAGTVTINYPVATYDIRSERNGRTITSRAKAGDNAVRIVSWQLQ